MKKEFEARTSQSEPHSEQIQFLHPRSQSLKLTQARPTKRRMINLYIIKNEDKRSYN
jgi:hypothetical protein